MKIGTWDVGMGDKVTIQTPQGQKRCGRVRILNTARGVAVLNGGGAYGTPLIAAPENILAVKKAHGWGNNAGLVC